MNTGRIVADLRCPHCLLWTRVAPPRVHCPNCGHRIDLSALLCDCPACKAADGRAGPGPRVGLEFWKRGGAD